MFEKLIAYHCTPALAGIKSSNIVSCSKKKFKNIFDEIKRLNNELNKNGIFFEILRENDENVLVMVYRKKNLIEYMQKDDIMCFMKLMGYPQFFSVDTYIEFLKERLNSGDFPHEIGAFLGYPLCDICGFMNHEQCLLVGYWKVYRNAEYAKMMFKRYNICRCAVLERLANGRKLSQIFCAA